jgi:hypothetical protein
MADFRNVDFPRFGPRVGYHLMDQTLVIFSTAVFLPEVLFLGRFFQILHASLEIVGHRF